MYLTRILTATLLVLAIQACKHPLEIEGEGDIVERLDGVRGCTLEQYQAQDSRCTENEVVGEAYVVSYEAVPREGWMFTGWEGVKCGNQSQGDLCEFNYGKPFVDFLANTFPIFNSPPSRAVFVREDGAINTVFEQDIEGPVLAAHCLDCHTDGGIADQTRLVFEDAASDRQAIDNITAFGRFLDTVAEGREYILQIVADADAHGATTFGTNSDEYGDLDRFLRLLEADDLYSDGADGVFTKDFGLDKNWAGRQTLNFPYYGTGSGETVTVQIKNNRGADPGKEGWVMRWSEEFNEPAGTLPNPDIWTPEIGDGTANGIPGWGNNERQTYTGDPENGSTDGDGNLVITVREADGSLSCYYGTCEYTSARLITLDKVDFAYGRLEARVKVAEGVGLWPAFWTLGTDIVSVSWPQVGEIDIIEFVGREPNEIFGTIHGPGYSSSQSFSGEYIFNEPVYNDFHTFAVEWEENVIRWYVDDVLYHTATPADVSPDEWVFNDNEQFLILNMAIGGTFGGQIDPDIQLPASMLVDYVRYYGSPDSAELWEATFVDNVKGWRDVEVPLGNLTRAAEQPDGAPNDGYNWFDVWGFSFILPRGGSVPLNDVEWRF